MNPKGQLTAPLGRLLPFYKEGNLKMTDSTLVKINLTFESDEVTIVCEDGGVACIRKADDLDKNTPRIATTDYYQSRLTSIDPDELTEERDVWARLGEGNMFYEDWDEKPFNSFYLICEALVWLGHNPADCVVVKEELFPQHFK